jgi:hypothetical protein
MWGHFRAKRWYSGTNMQINLQTIILDLIRQFRDTIQDTMVNIRLQCVPLACSRLFSG